jgi:5-methyltetrahydrofolate--homocysteine methyltransferase
LRHTGVACAHHLQQRRRLHTRPCDAPVERRPNLTHAELGFGHLNARDRAELIKQGYRGSRYSFGYPACPNLADQRQLLELLGAEKIGVELGDEDQLWPEQSTSAIVLHHPQARYFNV